jgi:hypothetical protein
MSEERNERGRNEEPGSQGANAAVHSAGEPSGSQDTRDLSVQEEAGVSPEELDAREERRAGPRKAQGPTERADDVPETTPAETPPEGS